MTELRKLRVFLCHASQDKSIVRVLRQKLEEEGWIDPWLDEKKLLPGEDWRTSIEDAVEASDLVVICLSNNSINKEGFVQKELRYAREISLEKPEGTIFLIPLRFEECDVPRGLRFFQWVDYFGENREQNYTALLESFSIRRQQVVRKENEKKDIEERIRREVEEKEKRELEERARELAKWRAIELARKEAEEKARRDFEERARKEAEEKTKREIEEHPRNEDGIISQKSYLLGSPWFITLDVFGTIICMTGMSVSLGLGDIANPVVYYFAKFFPILFVPFQFWRFNILRKKPKTTIGDVQIGLIVFTLTFNFFSLFTW